MLNSAAAPGGKGVWSPADLSNIENLLRSGLGIDSTRGDSLVVSALPFPGREAPAPWWKQRDNVVDIGSWVFYAWPVCSVGFWWPVRWCVFAQQRLGQSVLAATAGDPALASTTAQAALSDAAAAPAKTKSAMPVGPLLQDYDLPPSGSPVDVMVDHLKVLAAKEPERVAEVVKQWVQKNVRAE